MRTLMFFVTFVIFTVSAFAQLEYQHPSQNKPVKTQEQLNKSLETAKIVKCTGTIITLTGIGLLVAGFVKGVQLDKEYGSQEVPQSENQKFAMLTAGGVILIPIGLGTRIVGKVKVKKIKAELIKFQGSALGYGIGLKIRF